jgi:low temperature requirement protein LtrA
VLSLRTTQEPDRRPEPGLDLERGVTNLELFFDLVFVFAITQVSAFLYGDPTWRRLLQAAALLMTLWFVWSAYAWLGNTLSAEAGPVRVIVLAAVGPLVLVALAVPHAFGRTALAFGIGFFVVRALHVVGYAAISRSDPALRRVVVRLAWSMMPAATLILLAGIFPEPARAILWAAALAIDYGGIFLSGVKGWEVNAGHFAERHRAVIIVALGEAIVAVGLGANRLGLRADVIAAALLAVAAAAALWWVYFDVVTLVAERVLRRAQGEQRARLARDSYTYLHLPMVAGIVLFAFGVKTVLDHVGSRLAAVPALGLCGGVGLYLLALSAFKRRNVGSFNEPRLVAAAMLAAASVAATRLPALLSLGLVIVILGTLIAYESIRYRETRRRVRAQA